MIATLNVANKRDQTTSRTARELRRQKVFSKLALDKFFADRKNFE
jgi:hypothetical protein